jgi:hypothetical protein
MRLRLTSIDLHGFGGVVGLQSDDSDISEPCDRERGYEPSSSLCEAPLSTSSHHRVTHSVHGSDNHDSLLASDDDLSEPEEVRLRIRLAPRSLLRAQPLVRKSQTVGAVARSRACFLSSDSQHTDERVAELRLIGTAVVHVQAALAHSLFALIVPTRG